MRTEAEIRKRITELMDTCLSAERELPDIRYYAGIEAENRQRQRVQYYRDLARELEWVLLGESVKPSP